jgi:hypothetical protein
VSYQNCRFLKVEGTQTCNAHGNRWHAHAVRYGCQTLLGIRRLLRRSEEEHLEWIPEHLRPVRPHQPHDGPTLQRPVKDNYFTAARYYCVETICAPCGVVIAWAKFAKSESPTKILNFLEHVYPTRDVQPDYICIDKGCTVMKVALNNNRWKSWFDTTRFIVDSYHYINHRLNDYFC